MRLSSSTTRMRMLFQVSQGYITIAICYSQRRMAQYHQRAYRQKVARYLLLVITLLTTAHGQSSPWVLKFTEDFDRPLDYTRWSPHAPADLITPGVQTWIPDAIQISGGQAHITARRTKTGY